VREGPSHYDSCLWFLLFPELFLQKDGHEVRRHEMHKVITKGLGLFYLYAPALVSLPVFALLPTKATARVLVIIS
jgi:hypothetical protein